MTILLMAIDYYFINDYWWLFYQWLLVATLLMVIDGYSIGGYWWLLINIILWLLMVILLMTIGD